jgi:arsenate reductase
VNYKARHAAHLIRVVVKIDMAIYSSIEDFMNTFRSESISSERKEKLQLLIDVMQTKVDQKESINLNFICTHNSRRSHLAQIWAQVMAYHVGMLHVFCYSGGTEATALFHVVADTLQDIGFQIQKISTEPNPIFAIRYSDQQPPVIGFSKVYNDRFNPKTFIAVMTCTEADARCPFIAEAEHRISFTFDDPKAFDNTPQQREQYHQRSLQIATELYYVFNQIQLPR